MFLRDGFSGIGVQTLTPSVRLNLVQNVIHSQHWENDGASKTRTMLLELFFFLPFIKFIAISALYSHLTIQIMLFFLCAFVFWF